MARFLILWRVDTMKVPESPEEQMTLSTKLMNMVKEDLKRGMLDWGGFVGGHVGYAIAEGTEQEIALALAKYSPYIKFKVNPVLSVSQVDEIMKAMSKA
ncbi:hypothetical protein ANME2D_03130 [Candidatus Methanoperedens nitroreducens]|uniref:Muconolactone isomerase domain-containing protein n=1 Tax=Candidatus Methanoperedens nitratireducens TaxID=1392998 RepID=A0A062V3A8_9EURY|nr:DUF3303 family protein [Candidatus Methanoperedens nitroreducens]KCZ71098.1 hypothetical protein ANME2D_03130 [Candidatus Methanoperedens nitroreducens]MDJ1421526.1 hypothetical protein [Candidatus Methanoperedens sp.]